MRFKITIRTLFALLILPLFASTSPTPVLIEMVFGGVHKIPANYTSSSHSSKLTKNSVTSPLAKRDTWCNYINMNGNDMGAISYWFENTNPWTYTYLPHGSLTYWTNSPLNIRVCVRNNYWFDNTHVANWDIGWGVGYVNQYCCGSTVSVW